MEENNLLPLQTIINNQSDEVSANSADRTSLLSSTKNNPNGKNISHSSAGMKYYFHHEQSCFLNYFGDLVPDEAVIYASDLPFQYNERKVRYTKSISSPTDTTCVAAKRDYKILLGQRNNTSNMSSN